MNLILIATKVELSKLFSHKKYKILLLIQAVVCAIAMLFTSQNGFNLFKINLDIPSMPYNILSGLYTIVLPMLILMLTADTLSVEIENNTIKSVFLRPIERFKIYISKLLATITYLFINLMVVCVIVFFTRLLFGENTNKIFDIVISYAITIVPMISLAVLAAFISQLIGNATLSTFISIILYIVMQSVGFLSLKLSAMLFTSHFGWYRMFLGSQYNYMGILNVLLMNLSYIVLFTILGYLLFNKKEI